MTLTKTSRDLNLTKHLLNGGSDGLNTIVSYRNDDYHRFRPSLAVRKNKALRLVEELGEHPGLATCKEKYENGRLEIVQGMGYPSPGSPAFQAVNTSTLRIR